MAETTATHTSATAPEKQARSKYSCVACGGEAVWNPAKQKLICAFCGTEAPMPKESDAMPGIQSTDIVEHDLVAALRDMQGEARGWARTTRMIKCRQCQAISVFDPSKQAKSCEFCGASAIVDYDEVPTRTEHHILKNLFTNDNDHEGIPALYAPGRLMHVTEGSYWSWPRGWRAMSWLSACNRPPRMPLM